VPFTISREGKIINNFQLKLSHQGEEKLKVKFYIKEDHLRNKIELITPSHPTVLDQPEKKIVFFFRLSPSTLRNGKVKATLMVEDTNTGIILAEKEVSLVGPL
jgi:hypothetical protein